MWQILIVILGMIFGVYLGRIAREEIKQGKKYFLIAEKILLLIVILIFIRLDVLILIGVVIGIIICRFFKKIYFYLGLLVGSVVGKELLLGVISLIFLFSLINQSLNKFKLKNFLLDVIMVVIPFLLIQSFINSNLNILIGIGIGGVIEWARGSAW